MEPELTLERLKEAAKRYGRIAERFKNGMENESPYAYNRSAVIVAENEFLQRALNTLAEILRGGSEPVYQCKNGLAWSDISKETYKGLIPDAKRILYTAPKAEQRKSVWRCRCGGLWGNVKPKNLRCRTCLVADYFEDFV